MSACPLKDGKEEGIIANQAKSRNRRRKLRRRKGNGMTTNLEVVQGKVFDVIGVADAVIAQMAEKYLPLKIKGIDDKAGYQAVHEARMVVKNTRVKVEKHGKEMREDAVKYQKAVIAEEKRIVALMEPIENHLSAEEKVIDDALEAIKKEKERQAEEKIQTRITRLEVFGMGLVAGHYKLPFEANGVSVPLSLLKVCNDDQFEQFINKIQEAENRELARVAAIEANRKAEEERLATIAAEQEKERLRLDAIRLENERIAKEAEEKERLRLAAIAEEERKKRIQDKLEQDERDRQAAAIRAEEKRILDEKAEWERIKAEEIRAREAAKQKIFDDAKHAQELDVALKEAAEKARLQAEEDARQERIRAENAERLARIAAEKKAARAPDKEKLLAYVDLICHVSPPQLKTGEAKDIVIEFERKLAEAIDALRERAGEL